MSFSVTIATWVLFAICMLFALISPYISRLLFLILSNIKFRGKNIPLLHRLEYYLQSPTAYFLMIIFLYLACIVVFRDFWENEGGNGALAFLHTFLRFLFNLGFAVSAVFFAYRLSKLLVEVTRFIMDVYSVPMFSRAVIIEGVILVTVVLVLVLGVYMFLVLVPSGISSQEDGAATQVVSLLGSLNFITMTAIIGFAPAFRDIIAGLSMFADNYFGPNDLIRLVDVSSVGYIKEFRLRVTVLRLLDDTLCYIPNSKFLRYATINYSKSNTYVCDIRVPLPPSTPPAIVRGIIQALQGAMQISRSNLTNPVGGEEDTESIASSARRRISHEGSTFTATGEVDNHSMSESARSVLQTGRAEAFTEPSELWQNSIGDSNNCRVIYDEQFNIIVSLQFVQHSVSQTKAMQSETILFITDALQRFEVKVVGPARVSYSRVDGVKSFEGCRNYTD